MSPSKKRPYGTGGLEIRTDRHGREVYYARFYSHGRQTKRKLGLKRKPGEKLGLTNHPDAVGNQFLGLLCGRALPDADRTGRLARDRHGQRHGGVDQELPLARVRSEPSERLGLGAERHAQDHELRAAHGGRVVDALEARSAHRGGGASSGLRSSSRIAGPDDDGHSGPPEPHCEAVY